MSFKIGPDGRRSKTCRSCESFAAVCTYGASRTTSSSGHRAYEDASLGVVARYDGFVAESWAGIAWRARFYCSLLTSRPNSDSINSMA